jgi:Domain of unknown function (DUF4116)
MHIISIPSSQTNTQLQASSHQPALLTKPIPKVLGNIALDSTLANNTKLYQILDPLSLHAPAAYLALKECMIRNSSMLQTFEQPQSDNTPQTGSKPEKPVYEPLTQFLSTSKHTKLPCAQELLGALHIRKEASPQAMDALVKLINRHFPGLMYASVKPFLKSKKSALISFVKHTLKFPPKPDLIAEPIALGKLLNDLLQNTAAINSSIWKSKFKPETTHALETFATHLLKIHTRRARKHNTNPVEQQTRQDLEQLHQTMSALACKLKAFDEIREGNQPLLSLAHTQDPDIILAMIQRFGGAQLLKADETLRNNPTFMLQIVSRFKETLQHASLSLRDCPEIVSAAVKLDGFALQHGSARMKNTRTIAQTAIEQNGWAVKFISERLKKDPMLFLIAMKENCFTLTHAHPSLKKNREFMRAAMQVDVTALQHADKTLQTDPEFQQLARQYKAQQ